MAIGKTTFVKLALLLSIHCISCCVESTSSVALLKSKSSSSIERRVWKAYAKLYNGGWSSNNEYANGFIIKSSMLTPVQFVPGGDGDENDWKLVMPTTSIEEWEFYTTSSKSSLSPALAIEAPNGYVSSSHHKEDHVDELAKSIQRKAHDRKYHLLPGRWWERMTDDYNFKGFGVSLYKSFLYLKSVGIAFRCPLLANWDRWDRNPALPSVNAMFCIYFNPFSVSVCLTSSIRMEAVKYAFKRMMDCVQDSIRYAIYQFIRSLYVLFSIFLFPFHGKWFEPKNLPTFLQKPEADTESSSSSSSSQPPAIHYKSDIQERLGMSMSYGWNVVRGFYTRTSYWHLYLPTLRLYQQALLKKLPTSESSSWLGKHFASLGTDTSGPNPLPPNFFCTAVLSMSGFYRENPLRKASKGRKKLKYPSEQQERPKQPWSSKRYSISTLSIMNDILADDPSSPGVRLPDGANGENNKRKRPQRVSIPRGGDLIYLPDTQ